MNDGQSDESKMAGGALESIVGSSVEPQALDLAEWLAKHTNVGPVREAPSAQSLDLPLEPIGLWVASKVEVPSRIFGWSSSFAEIEKRLGESPLSSGLLCGRVEIEEGEDLHIALHPDHIADGLAALYGSRVDTLYLLGRLENREVRKRDYPSAELAWINGIDGLKNLIISEIQQVEADLHLTETLDRSMTTLERLDIDDCVGAEAIVECLNLTDDGSLWLACIKGEEALAAAQALPRTVRALSLQGVGFQRVRSGPRSAAFDGADTKLPTPAKRIARPPAGGPLGLTHLCRLEHLSISEMDLDDDSVASLRLLGTLTSLKLGFRPHPATVGHEYVKRGTPRDSPISGNGFAALDTLVDLTSLQISGNLNGVDLGRSLSPLHSLTSLRIAGGRKPRGHFLVFLIAGRPTLEGLRADEGPPDLRSLAIDVEGSSEGHTRANEPTLTLATVGALLTVLQPDELRLDGLGLDDLATLDIPSATRLSGVWVDFDLSSIRSLRHLLARHPRVDRVVVKVHDVDTDLIPQLVDVVLGTEVTQLGLARGGAKRRDIVKLGNSLEEALGDSGMKVRLFPG